MASQPIDLAGQGNPVILDEMGSYILAPGLRAEGEIVTGQDDGHLRILNQYAEANPKLFGGAIDENECRIVRTISLGFEKKIQPRQDEGLPPSIIRLHLHADAGFGSFIRVVHEKGHVTWHLPLNNVWKGGASANFAAGAWDYDIPHIEPHGEEAYGLYGTVGRKIITEVAFKFFEGAADELITRIVGAQQRKKGLGLKIVDPKSPDGPFPDFPGLPHSETRTKILLLVHGTFSSIPECFGDLIRSGYLTKVSPRYRTILGYDHDSLTLTPLQNARDLGASLTPIAINNYAFDLITHSRGGLIGRCLTEWGPLNKVEPGAFPSRSGAIDRLVMLGAPNSGTPIAENLMGLVNLVSNGMRLLPDNAYHKFLSTIVSVVKIAGHGITNLPGVEEQAPGSAFLQWLNSPPDGGCSQYSVAASHFKPDRYWRQLLNSLFTYAVFRGVANDLVVPCASVPECVPLQKFSHQWVYTGHEINHCSFFGNTRTQAFLDQALL